MMPRGSAPPASRPIGGANSASGLHTPPSHSVEMQSELSRQVRPPPQRGQALPPRSVMVSVAFLMPSAQVAPAQRFATHAPVAQSMDMRHERPAPHFGHMPPPQSASVSFAFLMKSVH